ncbi:hypothetical protein [Salibacterium halotolerans]|uniref:Uncharacterized protein n=1 Tax=Salibacterium halotolerans TaxID=1884432 RepID=A0A1I5PP26_9BACI|nr:hypothetical protein [Salibacterium halotolerans]SFP35902.1 hypothetical protein SAMN05518683_104186 [Salibacterium halotolerans]
MNIEEASIENPEKIKFWDLSSYPVIKKTVNLDDLQNRTETKEEADLPEEWIGQLKDDFS